MGLNFDLPNLIDTKEKAIAYLDLLNEKGYLYHPDDSLYDLVWDSTEPHDDEKDHMNDLMEQIYSLTDFDEYEYIFNLIS